LFVDPDRGTTNLGVTVAPVRVTSLADFGSLEDVSTRLLDAERKKLRHRALFDACMRYLAIWRALEVLHSCSLRLTCLRTFCMICCLSPCQTAHVTANLVAQDGFISVELLSQQQRIGTQGALFYSFEYDLKSTRGQKRVLSVVTIRDAKLLIFNGQHKCGQGGCSATDEATVDVLRCSAASFDTV
jgi:hypothetical protein